MRQPCKIRIQGFGFVVFISLFPYNLCGPVVGAVPQHLACYVEAFKDVEGSDHSQSRMGGWGGHHVMT